MIDGCPDRSYQRIGNSPGWDWSRGLTLQQPPRESRPTAFSRAHRLETPYICAEMDLEQFSVEELVAQARALAGSQEGDRLANELFRRHYSQVACWCLRSTGDRELAADLAQEIFVRAHQHLKSFQGQSKFSTWLYSIARNHCINAIKARSIRPAETSDEELAELPGDDELLAAERESSGRLAHQLLDEALDETEKKVFTLHYGDELTLATITRLLGLRNQSGAKAYIVSAKRKLHRCLLRWRARQQTLMEGGEP
jgi:RNA polymerase sigma-70 factor (ECF subfamily)